MKKLWQLIEICLGVFRWHPKIALRYLPIIEAIEETPGKYSILEVGSNALGSAPYLDTTVVGLDIEFNPPFSKNLIAVSGSALKIPFANNSFDFVISADMIEHIPVIDRQLAIVELIRVAKKKVFITVPCGEKSGHQDQQLNELYQRKRGTEFAYLKEHLMYGLPTVELLREMIKSAAHNFDQKVSTRFTENINLSLRLFLMKGWMSENPLSNLFFRKVLLVFIPVLRFLNHSPAYRQLVTVTLEE